MNEYGLTTLIDQNSCPVEPDGASPLSLVAAWLFLKYYWDNLTSCVRHGNGVLLIAGSLAGFDVTVPRYLCIISPIGVETMNYTLEHLDTFSVKP